MEILKRLNLTIRNTKDPEPTYHHCFYLAKLLKINFKVTTLLQIRFQSASPDYPFWKTKDPC